MVKKRVRRVSRTVQKNKGFFNKYLLLDWKEAYLLIVAWFLFIALHNLVNSIFYTDERILFFIAKWIIPIFFFIALIYTIFNKLRQ